MTVTFRDVWRTIKSPRASFNRAFDSEATTTDLDESKLYTWRAVRRQLLNSLWRDWLIIIVFLTASEAFGPGNAAWIRARRPEPDRYGIAYELALVVRRILAMFSTAVLLFLYYPLFRWLHLPSFIETTGEIVVDADGTVHQVVKARSFQAAIESFIWYSSTFTAACVVAHFAFVLAKVFIFVDSRPTFSEGLENRPTGTRRNWLVRLGLIASTLYSLAFGFWVVAAYDYLELLRATPLEYGMIIVPAQLCFGLLLASITQHLIEGDLDTMSAAAPDEKSIPVVIDVSGRNTRRLLNAGIDFETLRL